MLTGIHMYTYNNIIVMYLLLNVKLHTSLYSLSLKPSVIMESYMHTCMCVHCTYTYNVVYFTALAYIVSDHHSD